MTFIPMISSGGLTGWQLLQNTITVQRSAFNQSPELNRDAAYFQEKIGSVTSAEELVNDRRLLNVALAAFGLEDDIDSKYLIRRVIEEGAEDDDALANQLGDSRYIALAQTFNFETKTSYRTQDEGFAAPILAAYEANVRAELEIALQEPEFLSDPDYAALYEAEVEANIERFTTYFSENITSVSSVDDLMTDSDLFEVALTAFGVDRSNWSTSMLRRAFEQGTSSPNALANVLGDESLIAMVEAFSFDQVRTSSALQEEGFAEDIVGEYRLQLFEDAVSELDGAIGLALQFQRSIPALSGNDVSDKAKWYQVLGSTSMREVFETALNLPDGFSQIDIDKQLEVMREKAESRFGISAFSELEDPAKLNKIIHTYLLQDQISQSSGYGSQQIALTLLSSIRFEG